MSGGMQWVKTTNNDNKILGADQFILVIIFLKNTRLDISHLGVTFIFTLMTNFLLLFGQTRCTSVLQIQKANTLEKFCKQNNDIKQTNCKDLFFTAK